MLKNYFRYYIVGKIQDVRHFSMAKQIIIAIFDRKDVIHVIVISIFLSSVL